MPLFRRIIEGRTRRVSSTTGGRDIEDGADGSAVVVRDLGICTDAAQLIKVSIRRRCSRQCA